MVIDLLLQLPKLLHRRAPFRSELGRLSIPEKIPHRFPDIDPGPHKLFDFRRRDLGGLDGRAQEEAGAQQKDEYDEGTMRPQEPDRYFFHKFSPIDNIRDGLFYRDRFWKDPFIPIYIYIKTATV